MTAAEYLDAWRKYPGEYMTITNYCDYSGDPRRSVYQMFYSMELIDKQLPRIKGNAHKIKIPKKDLAKVLATEK